MTSPKGHMPGDLNHEEMIDRMVRVDQAGEYGAVRIYKGQIAVLGRGDKKELLQHMLEQEEVHLDTFNKMAAKRRVRPTILTPIWHAAGFALGAGTALLGEKAAMACTVAVEETIDGHYADQIKELGDSEPGLKETFEKFREEELEHRDIGYEHGAQDAPGYSILSKAIKTGSKFAIWVSERF
ncbi:Ubiquinone biosynthesis protein COQ7 [Candidatus Terasakiella magnetica]|uniref:3-demethoxyubiquinol 3-hydroxylase n=1 Tax=Candidatus Terasakiella magnetica TaxID=1867952 RepID=A0A1C3RJI5_9PROT|nr:demethoxyubiquinone hydroxylase family protein [Candidatus Terasakiella magnetica]SCA57428.1 Ubiquinone biosynthesis protein COQ7 [Candidatus Terasakiella magnetica]